MNDVDTFLPFGVIVVERVRQLNRPIVVGCWLFPFNFVWVKTVERFV